MKRTALALVLTLALIVALGAPVFAGIDDVAAFSEDMIGQKANQVNTNLLDAIEGKTFYADTANTFAVQMPSFMVSPITVSDEGIVVMVDTPSQSLVMVACFEDETGVTGSDDSEFESFEEFGQALHDILEETLTDLIEGVAYEIGELEMVAIDGMENALRINIVMTADVNGIEAGMDCVVYVAESTSGNYLLCMGAYLDLTPAELSELGTLLSTVIEY